MDDRYYPEIRGEADVLTIHALASEDPDYFTDPNCPYSEALKAVFTAPVAVDGSFGVFDETEIEETLRQTLWKLEEWGNKIHEDDTASQAAYFRLKATIVERLINGLEKVKNVKKVDQLIKFVVKVFDKHLPPDSRTQIMEDLDVLIKQEA